MFKAFTAYKQKETNVEVNEQETKKTLIEVGGGRGENSRFQNEKTRRTNERINMKKGERDRNKNR